MYCHQMYRFEYQMIDAEIKNIVMDTKCIFKY
jgi:hypothetical protein